VRFVAESVIRTTPERLFAFHELPDALRRLTPPWERMRVIESAPSLRPGARAVVDIRVAPLVWIRSESVHTVYEPPLLFEDQQVRGPFRRWRHRHEIAPDAEGARLTDVVEFEPPFALVSGWFVLRRLRKLFAYRHEVTREWAEKVRGSSEE
jgi:ligand-binding SRPBCC domain-containing protein